MSDAFGRFQVLGLIVLLVVLATALHHSVSVSVPAASLGGISNLPAPAMDIQTPAPTKEQKSSCAVQSCTPTPAPPRVPVPQIVPPRTTPTPAKKAANIQLLLTFSYHINNPASVAKNYAFVWGAETKQVAAFHASNQNMLVSYYIPFHRDGGVYGNSDKLHDLSYWQSFQPDWILYKCDRKTIAYEDTQAMPLDFTNPDMINWQVQTFAVPASQDGYNALAVDNFNLQNMYGACGFYRHGQWVQRYDGSQDDPQWRNDELAWLTQIQNALHQLPHPMLLVPNLGLNPVSPDDPFAQQIAAHTDGILDEASFTKNSHGYLTDGDWLKTIHYIQSVQQQNKSYYMINEVPNIDDSTITWSFANYLLCNEGQAALFISQPQDYGRDLRYPAYTIPIGNPTNEMYSNQNVYWRNYSGGLVVVNPSSQNSYPVTLPSGNYVDSNGNAVGQTPTLSPHSAMILLNGG